MNPPNCRSSLAHSVTEKLKASDLFQAYRSAFLAASGLSLSLEATEDEEWSPCRGKEDDNPFCRLCREAGDHCKNCAFADHTIEIEDGQDLQAIRFVSCSAGLHGSAIPIRAANDILAYLKIGRTLTAPPKKADWNKVLAKLNRNRLKESEIEALQRAYRETPVVEESQYEGLTTLVAAFSLQLSALATRLAEEGAHEPIAVTRAKQFINAHLDEKLTLEDVAEHVHVCSFYFCKIFKATTGMTFTGYVNRRRIDRAKRLLLRPGIRVTEVAYEVGYQSLSQFNRSFLKYAGTSPTKYRAQEMTGSGMLASR